MLYYLSVKRLKKIELVTLFKYVYLTYKISNVMISINMFCIKFATFKYTYTYIIIPSVLN